MLHRIGDRVLLFALGWYFLCALFSGSWVWACIWALATGAVHYISTVPSLNLLRRRLRVYGVALTVFSDYKVRGSG